MKGLAIKACLDSPSIRGDPDSSSIRQSQFYARLKVNANFSCLMVGLKGKANE